jgi:hypothetical protein
MRATKPEPGSITPKTAEPSAVLTLDLVGLAEAAELAGISRAALSGRREERRLGRRGWYEGRIQRR